MTRAPPAATMSMPAEAQAGDGRQAREGRLGYPQALPLIFFSPISLFSLFFPLFFHLPQRFSLNTPPIPHYNYKISFSISTINFLSINNYSWIHNTVFEE
jgi:hypothetical protein